MPVLCSGSGPWLACRSYPCWYVTCVTLHACLPGHVCFSAAVWPSYMYCWRCQAESPALARACMCTCCRSPAASVPIGINIQQPLGPLLPPQLPAPPQATPLPNIPLYYAGYKVYSASRAGAGAAALEAMWQQRDSAVLQRLRQQLLALQDQGIVFPRKSWPARLIMPERRCVASMLQPCAGGFPVRYLSTSSHAAPGRGKQPPAKTMRRHFPVRQVQRPHLDAVRLRWLLSAAPISSAALMLCTWWGPTGTHAASTGDPFQC